MGHTKMGLISSLVTSRLKKFVFTASLLDVQLSGNSVTDEASNGNFT